MRLINNIKEVLSTNISPDRQVHLLREMIHRAEQGMETVAPLVNEIRDSVNATCEAQNGDSVMGMVDTGAKRSKLLASEVRFDLLDSNDSAMRRLAKVFAVGFKKYGPDNWKKGFPNSEYYAHAREHMLAWIKGKKSLEDDLAHAVWNLCAIMWNEEHLPEMCDFPRQQKS